MAKKPLSEVEVENSQLKGKSLLSLAKKLGLTFKNINIFQQALVHSSYVNENPSRNNGEQNERLEFLGDAILSFVVCDYLYQTFPTSPEGELTKIKSLVVSRPILAQKARELNLGKYLLLGHGEEITGGRERDSILANALEALIGAIYLDRGIDLTRKFILSCLEEVINYSPAMEKHSDYKTLLQEYSQKHFKAPPHYYVIKEKGPDHAKIYHIEAKLPNNLSGVGEGGSKKEAEQNAAKAVWLSIIPSP